MCERCRDQAALRAGAEARRRQQLHAAMAQPIARKRAEIAPSPKAQARSQVTPSVRPELAGAAPRQKEPASPDDPAKTYRIVLKLGDLNALCAPIDTDLGRQQRLQLVASFYEPLGSKHAAERFPVAWQHYREQLGAKATDADALAALERDVTTSILSVGYGDGRLPRAGEFARLRLPGAFTISSYGPLDYPVPHAYRFEAESRVFDANPLLGTVPIVAHVEMRDSPDGEWKPAPEGLQVHFQLQVPDEVPAGHPAAGEPLRTRTVVRGGGGPKAYLDWVFAQTPTEPNDPQADNCPVERGGKRRPGACRASDYFVTEKWSRFHDGRSDPFPVASESPRPHAIATRTNAEGKAGVLFRPSRQGGDRFKIRVFLDPLGPDGAASEGTGESAVTVDTGTIVVWRVVKLGRYVRFDYPSGADALMKRKGGGDLDQIDFTWLQKRFARAFLDLALERTAVMQRRRVADSVWLKATRHARSRMPSQPIDVSQRYDVATLFPEENATHGLVSMLSPDDYAARRRPEFPAPPADVYRLRADWRELAHALAFRFMHFFTRGASGGLAIVQAPIHDSHTAARLLAGEQIPGGLVGGMTTRERGAFLFLGHDGYKQAGRQGLDELTLHELGHTLFLPHQWTDRDGHGAVSNGVAEEHDYLDYCVMSYQKNVRHDHDYCGRCNLKLRGWDTRGIPKNNG